MERDGRKCQTNGHAQDRDDEYSAAPETVDDKQIDEAAEEVGGADNNGDGHGLVETDKGKECTAIVPGVRSIGQMKLYWR